MTMLGIHETTMGQNAAPIDGGGGDTIDPGDGGRCITLPSGSVHCFPTLGGASGNGDTGGNGSTGGTGSGNTGSGNSGSGGSGSGSTGGTCSSTSPEFCTLSGLLGSQMSVGAPITPYLQDNSTPTVVPTQTSSTNASFAIILFIIAGALGYFYYRKHGGPSLHEAV